MCLYTISISPEDVNGVQTTVSVDVDDGGAGTRITCFAVKAGSGQGLLPQHLPAIDLELLLRVIGPTAAYDRSALAGQASGMASPPLRGRRARTESPNVRRKRAVAGGVARVSASRLRVLRRAAGPTDACLTTSPRSTSKPGA